MEQFFSRTKIMAGPGAVQQLRSMGIRKLLMVTDPFFMKNGVAQKLAGSTGAEKIVYFDQVTPDPSVELAAQGAAILRKEKVDTVVALGGGSAMDCAKAIVYFGDKTLPLIAIPTTSGSGSEVTDFAVLTHGQTKYPLVDPSIVPRAAILDSALLKELPPKLIADTGFDVLSHALEGYVATKGSAISRAWAKDAFAKAYCMLPRSYRGEQGVRQDLHMASTMAGIAFSQGGLGLCHAISHSLGGLFHLPHGRLNAILLPAVIELNATVAQSAYAALARSAGLGSGADTMAVRNLKNALIRLRRELNMPATLAQAGVDPHLLWQHSKQIVEGVLADPCCATNPVKPEDFMIRRILEQVSGHAP